MKKLKELKTVFNSTILVVMITSIIISCSSESINELPADESIFALKVGNEWVYKNYKRNTEGLYIDSGVVDSISIIGTQEINNNTYYVFRRWTTGNVGNLPIYNVNGEHFEYLRDSIGYLIRADGSIKYASNDYSDRVVYTEPWGSIYHKLSEVSQNITVEAGIFECLDTKAYAIESNNLELTPGEDHYYLSKGIGYVLETLSFVTTPYHVLERRLDSYNLVD